jgi:small subunit ribosomal protein S15
MYLTVERKKELFTQFGKSVTDTGSPESQIALYSERINHLTEHLKKNRKDFSTQMALLKLVVNIRRIMDYFKSNLNR